MLQCKRRSPVRKIRRKRRKSMLMMSEEFTWGRESHGDEGWGFCSVEWILQASNQVEISFL
jgi:hypothetical protein